LGTANTATTLTLTATSYDMYKNLANLEAGREYTLSVWVKLGSASNFAIVRDDAVTWNTIGGMTLNDGISVWRQIKYTWTQPTSRTSVNVYFGAHSETGQTQQSAGTVYIWNPCVYYADPDSDFSAFKAESNSGQALNHNSSTTIVYEDELYDHLNEYSTSTGKFTCKNTGIYHFDCCLMIEVTGFWNAGEIVLLSINKTGSTTESCGLQWWTAESTTSMYVSVNGSIDFFLVKGDSVEVSIYQNSGANLQAIAQNYYNKFSGHRVK
jgi:hypothetical protein